MNTCPLLFCFSLLFVCCRPISLHLYVCRYRIFCYHKLVNKDLYKNRIRKIHCFFIGGLGPQPLPSGYALGINSLVPKVWRVEIILNRSHHREHAHLIRVVILDIMCTEFDGSIASAAPENQRCGPRGLQNLKWVTLPWPCPFQVWFVILGWDLLRSTQPSYQIGKFEVSSYIRRGWSYRHFIFCMQINYADR